MVTKEIYKYPYNVKPEDDLKVFLSEIICEQVVKVSGGDKVKVLGMAARGNTKNINRFQTLMKKIYGVDLKY